MNAVQVPLRPLSLTEFVDIVCASGTPKFTKTRNARNRGPYDPAADFYRPLRQGLVEIHQAGEDKKALAGITGNVTDAKKLSNYAAAIQGYRKWWGKKSLTWFEPTRGEWKQHGLSVSVNPELGLDANGRPHLIKLYFKADNLTKNRIDIITHLMAECLTDAPEEGVTMSVLDIRRGKLISPTVPVDGLTDALNAELAYIAAIWGS